MSIIEIKRTSLADYEVLKMAYSLRSLDKHYFESFNAWQGAILNGRDKNSRPIIKSFKELFDYSKLENNIKGKVKELNKDIDIDFIKRIKEFNKGV